MQNTSNYRFDGIATALSAIHYGGDQVGGTIKTFRREKVVCADGKKREIPIPAGNGFRGLLRDCGILFMLRELGFGEEDAIKLAPAPFDFLTSGGALSKESGRGIDFAQRRKLREMIPLISIFGGATGRHIMEGKLQVGKWYPICKELKHILPPQYQELPDAETSVFDCLDIHQNSRNDDKKKERWQLFLPEEKLAALGAPATKITKGGDEIAEKPGTAQQMRYGHEVLIAGTRFYCWLGLEYVTQIEFEAFCTALLQWRRKPIIGGRSSEGLGLIDLNFDQWMHVSPYAETSGTSVGMPLGQEYLTHLHERKTEILALFREIA